MNSQQHFQSAYQRYSQGGSSVNQPKKPHESKQINKENVNQGSSGFFPTPNHYSKRPSSSNPASSMQKYTTAQKTSMGNQAAGSVAGPIQVQPGPNYAGVQNGNSR